MAVFISVCNWERFQHYKDRDPPWVKLYRDLLTTESWVLGTDTSRLVQVASVLLAARYSNRIPYVWTLIRKVTSLDCSEQSFGEAVNHLVSMGFLEIQEVTEPESESEQVASTALALARSRETEAEQSRAEAEQSKSARNARRATRLPDDFELTDERRLVAEAEKLPAERTFAKFVDYWRAASGAKARKHDWDATWRNWCRTEADRSRGNGASRETSQRRTRFEQYFGNAWEDVDGDEAKSPS